MVAFSKRPSGGTEQPGPNRLLLHGLDLEGPEEVLPGPDGTEAAAGLLEATDVRLQRQALGALVALEDATCSSAGAVAVLMLDVSHMMQEPSMNIKSSRDTRLDSQVLSILSSRGAKK